MKKMDHLKQMLSSLKAKAFRVLRPAVKYVVISTTVVGVIASFIYISARAPEMHGYWLRHKVGTKVYSIKDSVSSGGGTGFAIKAPSGHSYIMTNDHVCAVSKDRETVLVENEDGLSMRRKIIVRADFTDLCLIEGVPGVEGLEVGDEPVIGQIVAAVGHPALMPITLSRGEIITRDNITIIEGPISFLDPETGKQIPISPEDGGIAAKDCNKPKNIQFTEDYDLFFAVIKVTFCANVTKDAYRTNMIIQPGSSGSPVVNFWGNVVAVAFAGDKYGWGADVSHKDLTEFLKNY